MDRVEEIEVAIQSLLPEEYQRLAQNRWFRKWIEILRSADWISCSKKAENESALRLLREWPPPGSPLIRISFPFASTYFHARPL